MSPQGPTGGLGAGKNLCCRAQRIGVANDVFNGVGMMGLVTCQYPEDWVPPRTSSKSRQGAGRASTRCHVSCSFGPHLLAEVGSGATTCLAAPDLTSLLR
jgi:hypothetical protein